MTEKLDIRKLLGCEKPANIDKYTLSPSNLVTDPSNVTDVIRFKTKQ